MDTNINRNVSDRTTDINKGQKTVLQSQKVTSSGVPMSMTTTNVDPKSNKESKDLPLLPVDKLIIGDHTLTKTVYDKFKMCSLAKEANEWRNQLIYEIARHLVAEELIVYPLIRKKIPSGEILYQYSIKEHQKIKQLLYDVQSIDPTTTEFKSKLDETMKVLFLHFEEEENQVLPMIRMHVPEEELVTAGNQFTRRKFIAPTRPHTSVPEDPPTLEGLLGLLIAPIDKFRDLFTSYPDQDKVLDISRNSMNFAVSATKSKSLWENASQ